MKTQDEIPSSGIEGAMETLHHEHEFAQPLLAHLVELGYRITAGEEVEPKSARIGVALLDAYLHRVHIGQEDQELRPGAEAVAMPMCLTHLDDVHVNHGEMRARTRQVLAHIRQWETGACDARLGIGQEIGDLASRDYAAVQYEERFPFSCLQSALPEDVNRTLGGRLARHARTRAVLEANIARYLSGTFKT